MIDWIAVLFDLEIQGSDVDDTTARNYIYIHQFNKKRESGRKRFF